MGDWLTVGPPRHGRSLATLVLLTLCYYVLARASLLLAFAHSNATPVWPPSGVAFAAMLLIGYRAWPCILVGAFAANVTTFLANGLPLDGGVLFTSLLISTGNTLEALSGTWLIRRWSDATQPLGQLQNVYKFALTTLLMSAISATIGSTTLLLGGLIPSNAYSTVILTWWVGDTAGILLVTPTLISWLLRWPRWQPRTAWPALLWLAALAGLIAAVFWRRYAADDGFGWLPYLFVLCVAWASWRYGLRGASLVCLLAAGGAVLATIRGLGPFAIGTLNDALISLVTFIVLCSLVGMVLCADASERMRMRHGSRDRVAAQWATLLAGVGLTVLVWYLVSAATEHRAREQFDAECADISQRIARRMSLYETGLRSAQALFKAESRPSRAQWHDFVEGMDINRNLPGMMGLGYAVVLTPQQQAPLEAAVRSEGYPGFRVWRSAASPGISRESVMDAGPQSGPGAAPPSDFSAVVLYLEPFQDRNLRAFGYDMMSEPMRRSALLQAARTGQPALSDKVSLVQDGQAQQPGFLIYFPIYRRLAPAATPEQRVAALQGFVYSPVRASDLMADLLGAPDRVVQMEIFDGIGEAAGTRMYASPGQDAGDGRRYLRPYQRSLQQDVLHHSWTLRFTALPAFEDTVDRQKSHIVLLAGAIISLLFFGVVRALTARQAYATALAEEMTGALRASESSLTTAKDLAEAASRAKTEFVANMSHEIRTPLNAVLGMTHLLGNTTLSQDQQKYLDMIRSSGNSLLSILNDVLDFSKIEAGRMELAPAPFQLGTVLEAIATIMTVNAGEKDLELALGVEPDVPQWLMGDGLRLQQILVNLVGNAIKFTDRGAVSVLVERVGAPAAPLPGTPVTLRFTVRDSGIGIAPELQAQLFAPFSQADASMTRRFGGTGLGLAISRRLAAIMGGVIEVSSSAGVGSEFSLTVTLQCAAEGAPAGMAPLLPALQLLVIDDDAFSADYLGKTIRARGWRCDTAWTGAEALKLLERETARYDAVLVDWDMPGMNGLDVMQAVRALPGGAAMPVVLMVSAFGQGKLLHAGGAHVADAVLLKPVTALRLADTLQQALANRRLAGAPAALAHGGGADAAVAAAATAAADHTRIDGVRLLLVEDNPLNQLVAQSMLSHAGAVVDTVDNGRAALERLRTESHRYDLVLMDVQMPEMDGFEATSKIRSELQLDLPVLAMTAGVMASEREQCIASGMNDFIAKPIDVEQMLRVIARHLPPARSLS